MSYKSLRSLHRPARLKTWDNLCCFSVCRWQVKHLLNHSHAQITLVPFKWFKQAPKKKRGGEGSPGRGRSGVRSTLWREKEKPVSFRTQSASPPQPAGPHSRQSPAEWRGAFRASSQAGRSEMLWWSRVTRRSMFFPYFYASRRRVLRNGQYGSFPLKTVSSCCSTQILGYWLWKY